MTDKEKLKIELKKQFDKLNQYSEKVCFYFEEVLPNFQVQLERNILHSDFDLTAKSPKEEDLLNDWEIKYYGKRDEACNLEKLKNDFNEKFNKAKNKEKLINYELELLEKKYSRGILELSKYENIKLWRTEKNAYNFFTGISIHENGFLGNSDTNHLPKMRAKVSAHYKDFLEKKLIFYVPDKNEIQPETRENKSKITKPIKPFADWLITDNKKSFADAIKTKYKGAKGKDIALLILALNYEGKLGYGSNKELYKSMRNFFDWNIGSDESINSILRIAKGKGTEEIYKSDTEKIIKEITQLINQ